MNNIGRIVTSLKNSQILLRSHVLKVNCQCLPVRRFSITSQLNSLKNVKSEKYRLKDNVESNYHLIYKAPMEYYLSFAKNFTTLSVAIVLAGIGFSQYQNKPLLDTEHFSSYGGLTANEFEIAIMGLGFFGFAIALRIFMNRYPLRIYKNDTNYIAIFEGQLPRTFRKLEFKKGDVIELPPKGILPWRYDKFIINNNDTVIMLVNNFKTPSELHQMLSLKY